MSREIPSEIVELLALRALDLVAPEEVVGWATRRVADGADHDRLVELASLSLPTGDAVDDALGALAEERGQAPLSESQVGVFAAKFVARSLIKGDLDPIVAARRIWRIARLAPSSEPDLRPIIGFASEWEDDPENRHHYDEEIRAYARTLVRFSN